MRGFAKGSQWVAAALFLFGFGNVGVIGQLNFTSPPDIFTNREARVRLTVPAGAAARVDVSTNAID